jgi:hypothetical protein
MRCQSSLAYVSEYRALDLSRRVQIAHCSKAPLDRVRNRSSVYYFSSAQREVRLRRLAFLLHARSIYHTEGPSSALSAPYV